MKRDRDEVARYLLTHPAELGRRLGYTRLTDDLHGMWMDWMLTTRESITLHAHRGSYKTTCLTIVLALLLIFERTKNLLFLRKTDGDIAEVIEQVEWILASDLMLECYYSVTGTELVLTTASKSEITTEAFAAPIGAAQLRGISTGGSLTGKHADIIFTDDIVNLKDRISPAERQRTRGIYQELINVCNRDGWIINTGTPWHPDDAFGLMPPARKYTCYQTGLILPAKLDAIRRSMAPSLFAANYELAHIAAENALFKTQPGFTDDVNVLRDGKAHLDAAYDGEDYTALTLGKKVGGTIYLYGRMWRRHVDDVLGECIAEAKRFRCGPMYNETNADKGYLVRDIRNRGMNVHPYSESMNKDMKISTYLKHWWENVVFVEGTDPEYIQQILNYSQDADHDDAPDSAACMVRALCKGNLNWE